MAKYRQPHMRLLAASYEVLAGTIYTIRGCYFSDPKFIICTISIAMRLTLIRSLHRMRCTTKLAQQILSTGDIFLISLKIINSNLTLYSETKTWCSSWSYKNLQQTKKEVYHWSGGALKSHKIFFKRENRKLREFFNIL